VLQFAAASVGVVLVNVNPACRAHELRYVLQQADITTLFLIDRFKSSDFFALLAEICPELDCCPPDALRSAASPKLQRVVSIRNHKLRPSRAPMTAIDSAVADASRRARDHWFSDGLFTLGQSVYFVLLGLYFHYFPVLLAWPQWCRAAIFSLVLAVNPFLSGPVLRWFKWRITYPRTGYVATENANFDREVRQRHPEMWVLFAVFGFEGRLPSWVGLIALAVSLGILWILTRGRFSFAWLFIPGLALSGVLVSVLPITKENRFAYMLIALGILYFFEGATQLFRYLRQHPAPQA